MENNTDNPTAAKPATPVSPYVVIDMRFAGQQPFELMQAVLMAAEAAAKAKVEAKGESSTEYIVISKDDPMAGKVQEFIKAELVRMAIAKELEDAALKPEVSGD